jgi:PAS domain-containing protein
MPDTFLPYLDRDFGLFGIFSRVHSLGALAGAVCILTYKFVESGAEVRRRIYLIMVGVIISAVGVLAYMVAPFGFEMNYGAIITSLFVILAAVSVIRNDVFDAVNIQNANVDDFTNMILDASPMMIEIIDEDHVLIGCNRKLLEVFNLKNRDEFWEKYFDLMPEYQPCGETSRELCRIYNDRVLQFGSVQGEWTYILPCGTEIVVSPMPFAWNMKAKK